MNIPGFQHFPQLARRGDCWDTRLPPAQFTRFAVMAGVGLAAAAMAWLGLVWLLLTWLPSTL